MTTQTPFYRKKWIFINHLIDFKTMRLIIKSVIAFKAFLANPIRFLFFSFLFFYSVSHPNHSCVFFKLFKSILSLLLTRRLLQTAPVPKSSFIVSEDELDFFQWQSSSSIFQFFTVSTFSKYLRTSLTWNNFDALKEPLWILLKKI